MRENLRSNPNVWSDGLSHNRWSSANRNNTCHHLPEKQVVGLWTGSESSQMEHMHATLDWSDDVAPHWARSRLRGHLGILSVLGAGLIASIAWFYYVLIVCLPY
jgi:hypothetical protein